MTQAAKTRLITILLVGLIVTFSIHLFDRWFDDARVDLTEDNLYSLTEGSKQVLQRMRDEGVDPVDVTLYFSQTTGKTLPKFIKEFISYDRYLRSLLREYERAAGGKVRTRFVDPEPDSDPEQDADDFGLEGKMINQDGDRFFFGMTFETQTGSREVIEFLWPNEQENVEYEITKTLSRLIWPERQRVGVLSSLEVFGGADDPYMAQMLAAQGRQPEPKWIAVQLLEELYDVSRVPADTEEISTADYDLLVVIHPKDLPAKTRFAIDQFVISGGNALVFVDPYALPDRPPQNPQQPWMAMQYKPSSNLEPLFSAWGLNRPEDAFVADFELAQRRVRGPQGGTEALVVDLGISASDAEETIDSSSPILQGLTELNFFLAGALREVASDGDEASSDGIERTALITTTKSGNTIEVQPGFGGQGQLAYTDFNSTAKLRDALVEGTEPVALAYMVRGRLPSAYPNGIEYPSKEAERPPGLPPGIELPPPEDAEMIRKEPLPEEQRKESAVVVFSDVDFISDQLAFISNPFGMLQAANDNHRVMMNAVDFLLGSEELMSVRAKRAIRRPFELFDEIEAQAEKDTIEREQQINADVESFQDELRVKQSEITTRNAALFQKKLQDEVDELNEKIREGSAELRDIRRERRARLEGQEAQVRFAILGWMPILILGLGFFQLYRRRQQRIDRIRSRDTRKQGQKKKEAAAAASKPSSGDGGEES
jgi:ABC-type uncharacterized transport system involved in gliding motility auxiliary subunit